MNIFKKFIFVLLLLLTTNIYAGVSELAQQHRLEGYRYQRKGDLENAVVYYRKAISEDSHYATPYNDLGIIYEEKGLYDSAENAYLKAIKIDPNYAAAYSNLAYLSENKGDIGRAIFYWKKRLSVSAEDSTWSVRAKEKIAELEKRKHVVASTKGMKKEKATYYEKKRKRLYKGWKIEETKDPITQDLANKYFHQGLQFYNKKEFDKALGAFKMARSYDTGNKEISKYIVKIQKIRSALEKSGLPTDSEYKGIVSKEDLMLAKDHFKLGLDFYADGLFARAYSSFTLAMTYNPYDEIIRQYVNDTKIKIEEEKVKKEKLKQQAKQKAAVKIREPKSIRKEMVSEKKDIMNKGFIKTTEDLSVEGFISDGKDLYAKKRYNDAVYVWKQAILLDVEGIYHDELESLINQARVKQAEYKAKKLDELANSLEEERLAKVSRAAIPTEIGSTEWDFSRHSVSFKHEQPISKDKEKLLKKLEERYTLHFKDASLFGVVELLSELTGMNIVIDTKELVADEIEKKHITFKVSDMPLMEIIQSILRFTEADYLIENNMIWITTKEKINKADVKLMVYNVSDIIGKMFDFPGGELGSEGFKKFESSGEAIDTGYSSSSSSSTTI